jgi:hypothetical protein
MYITTKYICFYSNLFGLEKKIRIPYAHIKSITKENTAMVIPNAIAICTGKFSFLFLKSLFSFFYSLSSLFFSLADKKDYTFRSFWDREECYRILITFLEKFRQGGGRIELSVPRTNSDAPLPNDSSSSPTAAGHSSVKLASANSSTAASQAAQEPTSNAGVSSKRASVAVPRPASMIIDSTTISNALAAGNGNNDDVLDSGE